MELLCTLEEDICCPHRKDGKCGINNEKCGFSMIEKIEKPKKYVRKERWYEKYYR